VIGNTVEYTVAPPATGVAPSFLQFYTDSQFSFKTIRTAATLRLLTPPDIWSPTGQLPHHVKLVL